MNWTVVILVLLVIIYIPVWVYTWRNPSALRHGLEKWGPVVKINTHFGLRFMERFGRYHRFWRAFGIFSQIVSLVLMALMVYMMVVAVVNLPTTLSRGGVGVEYVLAIPGLNPILPLWYGLLALIVAMVCHEMAHGLQSRSNGIGVKHSGLLYGVVPLGAFVEPDQEEVVKAPRRAKIDLYTAGISTNFVIAAVCFLLFSSVMLGGLSSPYENNCAIYGIASDSPASEAGLPAGAIILDVNGDPFEYTSDYTLDLGWTPGDVVSVHYRTEGGDYTKDLVWGTYVSSTVDGSPSSGILDKCWLCTVTYHSVTYKLYTAQAFSNFMKVTKSGETVTVGYSCYEEGSLVHKSCDLVLGTNGSIGYLGVYTTTSGMNLITPSMLMQTASNPLYGSTGVLDAGKYLLSYMTHPFSGFDPMPDSVKWWYGDNLDLFWIVCTALYWIFWINLMLGITNALPCYPFDGGYVLYGWIDGILEKGGCKDRAAREAKADGIVRNISSLVMFLYLMVIMAAIL